MTRRRNERDAMKRSIYKTGFFQNIFFLYLYFDASQSMCIENVL